jgi:hypothetical protein
MRWDNEFQINGLWLRQASRCEVSAANGAGNSGQRRTLSGSPIRNLNLDAVTLRSSARVGMDDAAEF